MLIWMDNSSSCKKDGKNILVPTVLLGIEIWEWCQAHNITMARATSHCCPHGGEIPTQDQCIVTTVLQPRPSSQNCRCPLSPMGSRSTIPFLIINLTGKGLSKIQVETVKYICVPQTRSLASPIVEYVSEQSNTPSMTQDLLMSPNQLPSDGRSNALSHMTYRDFPFTKG